MVSVYLLKISVPDIIIIIMMTSDDYTLLYYCTTSASVTNATATTYTTNQLLDNYLLLDLYTTILGNDFPKIAWWL